MIAEKHLPSKTFRLALAPSIVNPRVNRLWLIPADRSADGRVDPNFQTLTDQLRTLYKESNSQGAELSIYALIPEGVRHYSTEYMSPHRLGTGEIMAGDKRVGVTFQHDVRKPWQHELRCLLAECGAALPNRIRESLNIAGGSSTAIAWWMCAVWKYSKIPAGAIGAGYLEKIEKDPVNPDNDKLHWRDMQFLGWHWSDPIGSSLSAIEAMGLLQPSLDDVRLAAGSHSRFMSKREFAQRVRQDPNARPRQVERLFNRLDKQQEEGSSKWSFRLDTIEDESLRKKLEGPPPF
ncbi:MAG TPA: hypothetical protein VFG04_18990 [Planctomycetaceae bacterium]|nr:hypothetical protein [Planctomycetaceae bacterium]